MRTFLDTNILVYAQGSGVKCEVARRAILAGGVISVQVLNEFAAVLRRKFGFEWDVIIEALADLQTALDPVRPISIETHTEAVSLARSHGLNFHDSLIVASVASRNRGGTAPTIPPAAIPLFWSEPGPPANGFHETRNTTIAFGY